jgi:hypothetical protein
MSQVFSQISSSFMQCISHDLFRFAAMLSALILGAPGDSSCCTVLLNYPNFESKVPLCDLVCNEAPTPSTAPTMAAATSLFLMPHVAFLLPL